MNKIKPTLTIDEIEIERDVNDNVSRIDNNIAQNSKTILGEDYPMSDSDSKD